MPSMLPVRLRHHRVWVLAWASGVAALGWSLIAAEPASTGTPKRTPSALPVELSALMKAKLASSQTVLEGLVTNDFEQIQRGGEELRSISLAGHWKGSEDQAFRHHRTEMQRQAEKLVSLAESKNLDGASFAYMHALTTCISCHTYCRDVLHIADEPRGGKVVPIPVTAEEMEELLNKPVRR
jgi:hypothetical protein